MGILSFASGAGDARGRAEWWGAGAVGGRGSGEEGCFGALRINWSRKDASVPDGSKDVRSALNSGGGGSAFYPKIIDQ